MQLKQRKHLIETYPDMFSNQAFQGFDCNTGWFDILDGLFADLCHHIKTSGCKPVYIAHVKQNSGALHIRYAGGDQACHKLIEDACSRAARTCDICAFPGMTINEDDWLRTRCTEHKDEHAAVV